MTGNAAEWWRHAVVYQVYVRSFADSDGDGIGDLPGITSRLPYLRDLGVDAVWLTPFYTSPQHDHGYDVANYRQVDPLFGSLDDFDHLLATAHDLGLRLIVDLVPNHTSDEHEWFQAALAAPPGSPERARYVFRRGKGDDGDRPPNNWRSVFGGSAWDRVGETDQWFLHLFDSTQPDLDWTNPEVGDMFEDVLRFWLDRGVDGFRVDVAHGLAKDLRDQVITDEERAAIKRASESDGTILEALIEDEPMWDQPAVHDVYRRWHQVLADYDGDRMAVAEAWARTPEAIARYVREDELHQAFNFGLLQAEWSAPAFGKVIETTLAALAEVAGSPTWVLSNHDVPRHATRYGGGEVGRARARAATLLALALPGSSYVYQGEELGLEDGDVAPEHRQDPSWLRTGKPGRDGCRVPIPWSGDRPPYGFGPGADQPWIPQPDDWSAVSVAAQTDDPASTLEFYRTALAARRAWTSNGPAEASVEVDGDLLVIRRGQVSVASNFGADAVPLPEGEVLVASGPVGTTLPPGTTVWLSSNRAG